MKRLDTQQASASNAKRLDESPSPDRAVLAALTGLGVLALAAAAAVFSVASNASADAKTTAASPLYGVTIPEGYRQWRLIAPAIEAEPLNELRAVLGNAKAVEAYDQGSLPFPDGTVLVKLAWKQLQSSESPPATVPGAATTVQVMVKDAKKYAASGGWGFGRYENGKPVDLAQHQTCFACHQALVKNHDYVFTRLAR